MGTVESSTSSYTDVKTGTCSAVSRIRERIRSIRFDPSARLHERVFPMMLHKNAPDKVRTYIRLLVF